MNGLRFEVGELAVIAADVCGEGCEGSIVEILEVGPLWDWTHVGTYERFDYKTTSPKPEEWDYGLVYDIELRKLNPPAEPASLTRVEEPEAVA